MNRKIRAVAASLIVTVFPAVGLADAQAPSPTSSAQAPPRWSIGAGVSPMYLELPLGLGRSQGLLLASELLVPGVTATVERRLSSRSWLVLGLQGSVLRDRADVAEGEAAPARNDARRLGVSAGLRRAVTRPSAPAEVSVFALVMGGIFDGERRDETRWSATGPTSRSRDLSSWSAGAQAGISIERELSEGLSVRIATPFLQGRYLRGSIRERGMRDLRSSAVVIGAALAPTLELRLQF